MPSALLRRGDGRNAGLYAATFPAKDSFRIARSDALIAQFNEGLGSVTLAALFLGRSPCSGRPSA